MHVDRPVPIDLHDRVAAISSYQFLAIDFELVRSEGRCSVGRVPGDQTNRWIEDPCRGILRDVDWLDPLVESFQL